MSKRDFWEWFKDKFTDILGGLIMIAVCYGVWVTHKIELLWDGIAGLIIGFVLLMFPDGVIISFIKNWAHKKFGKDE